MKNKYIPFAEKWASDLGVEISEYLGNGDYGAAFKVSSNQVIKITTDKRELFIASKLLNKETEYFVEIYQITMFENGLIGILQEFVKTDKALSETMRSLCQCALDNKQCMTEVDSALLDHDQEELQTFMINYHEENNALDLRASDLHGSNIGYRFGGIVAFDQRAFEDPKLNEDVESHYQTLQNEFKVTADIDDVANEFRPQIDF